MAIVSFAGSAEGIGRIPLFEFQRFLQTLFPQCDKFFYHDVLRRWYHKGIQGLTSCIPETAAYLQRRLEAYDRVLFLGASAGGYAAILYGTLVQVRDAVVIAFNPQTLVRGADLNQEFVDLKPVLEKSEKNNNKNVFLVGDTLVHRRDRHHHISQCERVEHIRGVVRVIREPGCSELKGLRDSGRLRSLVLECLDAAYKS